MGDKQPLVKRGSDKVADEPVGSDSDSSLSDIECETCGVSFSDVKNYQNHVKGKKHQKKLKEGKLKDKLLVTGNNDADGDENEDNEDADEIHCEICNKNFTGYISYAAHMKGTLHSKNVKKQILKEKFGDMPEVLKNDENENNSDEDDVLQKPYAKCTACQKEFSGPEPFKMHMKSAAHLKKVKQQKLKASEAKNSDDENDCEKCEVCQKSFSGIIPFQIHMKSNIHKKNLERVKVAEEMKEYCANDDFKDGYVCKECKKAFSDPLAFRNHLKNNSHERQKAKDALVLFLKEHPEIVFVTPFEKDSENESDSEETDPKYYLICKLCHVSFSGPESAQDHVKSKKHINTKKEKKNLRRIKELQKNPTESFIDKNLNGKDDKSTGEKIPNNVSSENGNTHNSDDFELI